MAYLQSLSNGVEGVSSSDPSLRLGAMSYEECAHQTAQKNDLLRRTCTGDQLEISPGVAALPSKVVGEALFIMRTFEEFNTKNDPYQNHDFGSFDVDGHTFLFQVDAKAGVCSLMLSSEYRGLVRSPTTAPTALMLTAE